MFCIVYNVLRIYFFGRLSLKVASRVVYRCVQLIYISKHSIFKVFVFYCIIKFYLVTPAPKTTIVGKVCINISSIGIK